jgi:hypothetical protein
MRAMLIAFHSTDKIRTLFGELTPLLWGINFQQNSTMSMHAQCHHAQS